MKRNPAFTTVICTTLFCTHLTYAQDDKPQDVRPNQLLAGDQGEHQRALEEVQDDYVQTRRTLALQLEIAARDHKKDDGYMSPLHCTILAVERWRVFEADEMLLSIVDYRLDPSSLPVGLSIGGEYYYPAASALASLRVDTDKLIRALVVQAQGDRQIRLLTWVLVQRAGSADKAKAILEAAGRNEKFEEAINLLDSVEHESDLLPSFQI